MQPLYLCLDGHHEKQEASSQIKIIVYQGQHLSFPFCYYHPSHFLYDSYRYLTTLFYFVYGHR